MEKKKKILVVGEDKPYMDKKLSELGISEKFDVEVIEKDNFNSKEFNKKPKLPALLGMASMVEPFVLNNYSDYHDYPPFSKVEKRGNYRPIRNSKDNPKINRNNPCPCGSGKKYKHCCINKRA